MGHLLVLVHTRNQPFLFSFDFFVIASFYSVHSQLKTLLPRPTPPSQLLLNILNSKAISLSDIHATVTISTNSIKSRNLKTKKHFYSSCIAKGKMNDDASITLVPLIRPVVRCWMGNVRQEIAKVEASGNSSTSRNTSIAVSSAPIFYQDNCDI